MDDVNTKTLAIFFPCSNRFSISFKIICMFPFCISYNSATGHCIPVTLFQCVVWDNEFSHSL